MEKNAEQKQEYQDVEGRKSNGFLTLKDDLCFSSAKRNQKLRSANLQIFDRRHCNREYQQRFEGLFESNWFTSKLICAGSRVSKSQFKCLTIVKQKSMF